MEKYIYFTFSSFVGLKLNHVSRKAPQTGNANNLQKFSIMYKIQVDYLCIFKKGPA